MKNALFWKLLERFGVQGIQFILQIVLARVLDPEHYGILSLMVIFTNLANVFIQQGFNTALVQNKEVTEDDYSSVLWVSLGVAALIYGGLFVAAPYIAAFYEIPDLVAPFRALCLILFPGALNSVQVAIVSRKMEFKKVFLGNIAGIVSAGIVGIALAYAGAGLWALVVQNILNVIVTCVVMLTMLRWKPRLVCNWKRVGILFSYGWKLLAAALLEAVYMDLRSIVIGKKYDSGLLGYYNRGKQFPQFIINSVNGAVQSVLLPAMSAEQDNMYKVKTMMRGSVTLSSYIIFPMMAGLAGVATPLVQLLLTDKWLPCVPYMQIYCFIMAFYPVHTSNLQAINAVGRSDIALKLEIIKKIQGVGLLVIAVLFFDSPIAIAMTGVFSAFPSSFINAYPNKQLIGYSYLEQIKDILPSLLASIAMCGVVLLIGMIQMPTMLVLVVQVIVGIIVYVVLSFAFKLEPFYMLLGILKETLHKGNQK